MTHRAEVLLDTDEPGTMLGEFETATQARAACVQFEGGGLSWTQPLPEMWEARVKKRRYRVLISL